MNRTTVESTAVESVGYYNKLMEIRLANGEVYQYRNVPKSVFFEMLKAESQGKFFNEHIKPHYRFMKV